MTDLIDKLNETHRLDKQKDNSTRPFDNGSIGVSFREDARDDVLVDIEKHSEYNPDLLPPDGGYGWAVSIAAMFCVFATWGSNSSYGVFLDYYLGANVFPGATDTDFALIGGIVVCLAMGLAPFCSLLMRIFGARPVMISGVVLQMAGYLLASFATTLPQLYVTQGFMVGASFGLVYMPATLTLPTWFTTNRATSFGIANLGSGLGGLAFSLAINAVIERTGTHRWALRMVCFVTTFVSGVALLVVKPFNEKPKPPLRERLTLQNIKQQAKETCDLSIFYKHYELALIGAWFCMTLLGYILCVVLTASYALSIGLTHTQALNLTSIINAAQLAGRPLMGYVADRCGRYNSAIGFTAYLAVVIFALWINATNYGVMIAFCATFGMACGIGTTLGLSLSLDYLGEKNAHHITTAWGGLNILSSPFLLVAGVIGLTLTENASSRPYLHSQIFAGVTFAVGTLLLLPVRESIIRRKLRASIDEIILKREDLELEKSESGLIDLPLEQDSESGLIDLQLEQDSLEKSLSPTVLGFVRRCFRFQIA